MVGELWGWLAAKAAKRGTPESDWIPATVRASDVVPYGRTSDAASLMARARSHVLIYATLNARMCAAQTLRLYRPSRGGRKGRKVTDRKRLAWLKGDGRNRPGAKTVLWSDQAGDIEEVLDHPALDLMRRPNPFQRGSMFAFQGFLQWEITGKRFSHFDGESLYPMLSQFTRIVASETDFIGAYWYGRDQSDEVKFEPDEVFYHRFMPHPSDPFEGMGPLHMVLLEADTYTQATTAEYHSWENGARPDYAIGVPPEASPDQIKLLKAQIQAEHRGVRNRGKFLITALSNVTPLAFTPKEMEYLAGKADLRSTIREAFGVPESLAKLNDANLASSLTGHVQYQSMTLLPRLNADAEEWTETLLPALGVDPGEMWFAYDNPVAEDREALRADVAAYVGKPVWTVNEARAEMGYDPIGGGDVLAEPAAPFGPPPVNPTTNITMPPAFEPKAAKCCDHDHKAAPPINRKHGIHGPVLANLQRKDDRNPASVDSIERLVRLWFDGLRERVKVEGGKVTLPPGAEAELQKILGPAIDAYFAAGAVDGFARVDASFDPGLAGRSREFLDGYTIRLARSITEETEANLRSTLSAAIGEGLSVDEAATRVGQALGEQSGYRAERIARTETTNAFVQGNRAAWKETGVTHVRWMLAPNACPVCEALAAKFNAPQAIDQPFMKLGDAIDLPDGTKFTASWKNVDGPPLHPACVLPDTKVSTGTLMAAIRARYSGNVVTIRTASGRVVTVTENHYLLGSSGFVRAASIQNGDDLVCACVGKNAARPDLYDAPSTAADVFSSLRLAGSVRTYSVPPTTEYLHGDGVGVNGDIDVVATDSLLRRNGNATSTEHCGQCFLLEPDIDGVPLDTESDLDAMLLGLRFAAHGRVARSREAVSVLFAGVGHADIHSLGAIARRDPALLEPLGDGLSTNAGSLGECLDGLAGLVECDKVVSVETTFYDGPVHDFSTESGAYICNGIVSHNCRCDLEPVVE